MGTRALDEELRHLSPENLLQIVLSCHSHMLSDGSSPKTGVCEECDKYRAARDEVIDRLNTLNELMGSAVTQEQLEDLTEEATAAKLLHEDHGNAGECGCRYGNERGACAAGGCIFCRVAQRGFAMVPLGDVEGGITAVLEQREAETRKALINLGWIPPAHEAVKFAAEAFRENVAKPVGERRKYTAPQVSSQPWDSTKPSGFHPWDPTRPQPADGSGYPALPACGYTVTNAGSTASCVLFKGHDRSHRMLGLSSEGEPVGWEEPNMSTAAKAMGVVRELGNCLECGQPAVCEVQDTVRSSGAFVPRYFFADGPPKPFCATHKREPITKD